MHIFRKSIELFIIFIFLLLVYPPQNVSASEVRVVIDPGHGGENTGADYNGFLEKDMTLRVALAMQEELQKYEGIEVFLTRDSDLELSLAQRASYAKEMNADFLFCLHFNMSEEHTLFGAEVWVSAFGDYYAKGYDFAAIELSELDTLGLYRRGIKTKLNKKGSDYYGVIKGCTTNGVPSVIIEHCHLDQAHDVGVYETNDALKQLGILDATAVAKYYHLKSEVLNRDYSDYFYEQSQIPVETMKPDSTPPSLATLSVYKIDSALQKITYTLTGEDLDSGLLYYDYSFDNGETYSPLQRWNQDSTSKQNTITITQDVPMHTELQLVCRIYNGYDLYTKTNRISFSMEALEESNTHSEQLSEPAPASSTDLTIETKEIEMADETRNPLKLSESEQKMLLQIILLITVLSATLFLFFILLFHQHQKKKRKHRKHRK